MKILKALIDFLLAYAITQGNDRVYKKTAYLFIHAKAKSNGRF